MALISIVIATKNRIPYAICAINTILNIPDSEMELVVQDNSDTRELEDYIHKNIDDLRLIFNYTPPPFSSMDNFNKAVSLASGEYLCLIGDDDGVNPEIIEAVRWAKENDIDSLKPSVNIQYLWPCVSHSSLVRTAVGGTFSINEFSGKVTYSDVKVELEKLVKNGGQRYLELNLPKLYHGIVKRKCMEKICELTGDYLGGLSPDIYAAIALANVVKKIVSVDYPLTIPGACNASTSIASLKGKHTGRRLEDAIHFRDREAYTWHDQVPRFFSVETIWADSALVALEDFNRSDLISRFNLPMLHAYCFYANPHCGDIIFNNMFRVFKLTCTNAIIGIIRFVYSFMSGPGWKLCGQVIKKLRIRLKIDSRITIAGVKDISEATHELSSYLDKNGQRFHNYV